MFLAVSRSVLFGAPPGAALGAPARMKFYPFRVALSTDFARASSGFDNAERRRL